MFKVSHAALIFLSGCIWLIAGCFLLSLGLNFIVSTLLQANISQSHPILTFLTPYVGNLDNAALLWIVISLFIGFLKGKKVFAKAVKRAIDRIRNLPNPAPLGKIYPPAYYLLLASMGLLGFLMRYVPIDVRGGVDVAVGSALINGAVLYFRGAWAVRQSQSHL